MYDVPMIHFMRLSARKHSALENTQGGTSPDVGGVHNFLWNPSSSHALTTESLYVRLVFLPREVSPENVGRVDLYMRVTISRHFKTFQDISRHSVYELSRHFKTFQDISRLSVFECSRHFKTFQDISRLSIGECSRHFKTFQDISRHPQTYVTLWDRVLRCKKHACNQL